jgi:hypothetical protein
VGPPLTWRGRFGTRCWPAGQAKWLATRVERPPLTRASPPHVDAWQPSVTPNCLKLWLAGQGVGPTSRPLGPLGLGSGPTWSMCQIHPHGDDDFNIWLTSLCHPFKWSNLVPKFLKSNKHYNRGSRLVDKVNTWLFYTFT